MFRYYYYCSCLLVFIIVIVESQGVSVLPDNDDVEPMKPSPIDESRNEKSLINLERILVDKANASKNKRQDSSDDDKSDVKYGDNVDGIREKGIRKFPGGFPEINKFAHCCGSKFEVSGPSPRPESGLQFTMKPYESDRYPNRFGSRPDDRYGWQSSSGRPTVGPLSGGSLYGGQGSRPDRYGGRPYGHGGSDGEYGRHPAGPRPLPNRPGHGHGDNGAYGSSGFETSRPGVHFSGVSRPPGYGIHGTIGEQDEFPGDAGSADAPPHPPPNIQTQKAVALKALAGVALLGAAAALAANPLLLPVGYLAGRRKRAVEDNFPSDDVQFLYEFLKNHVPGIDDEKTSDEFWNEPKCIARLTCELQNHYFMIMKNDKSLLQRAPVLKQRLEAQMKELVKTEIISAEDVQKSLKLLSKISSSINSPQNICKTLNCILYNP